EGQREGRAQARARVVDLEARGNGAEPAPPRSPLRDPRARRARLGGRRLRARGDQGDARLAALAREHDRRRDERNPAQHHREARSRFAPSAIDASAEESDDGYVLEGEKVDVDGGTFADTFIVSARTGRNLANVSLFVVPAKELGVKVVAQSRIDGRSSAIVRF